MRNCSCSICMNNVFVKKESASCCSQPETKAARGGTNVPNLSGRCRKSEERCPCGLPYSLLSASCRKSEERCPCCLLATSRSSLNWSSMRRRCSASSIFQYPHTTRKTTIHNPQNNNINCQQSAPLLGRSETGFLEKTFDQIRIQKQARKKIPMSRKKTSRIFLSKQKSNKQQQKTKKKFAMRLSCKNVILWLISTASVCAIYDSGRLWPEIEEQPENFLWPVPRVLNFGNQKIRLNPSDFVFETGFLLSSKICF